MGIIDHPTASDRCPGGLEPLLPTVSQLVDIPEPMREVVNGILYVLRGGIPCAPRPASLGHGLPTSGAQGLGTNQIVWRHCVPGPPERGRDATPSGAIIDSQSVKDHGKRGPRGYDAGKKVPGARPTSWTPPGLNAWPWSIPRATTLDRRGQAGGQQELLGRSPGFRSSGLAAYASLVAWAWENVVAPAKMLRRKPGQPRGRWLARGCVDARWPFSAGADGFARTSCSCQKPGRPGFI